MKKGKLENHTNENGYCPFCYADMDDKDMVQVFLDQGNDKDTSEKYASYHGYGPGHTKFSKLILIKPGKGEPSMLKCYNCSKEWPSTIGVKSEI